MAPTTSANDKNFNRPLDGWRRHWQMAGEHETLPIAGQWGEPAVLRTTNAQGFTEETRHYSAMSLQRAIAQAVGNYEVKLPEEAE